MHTLLWNQLSAPHDNHYAVVVVVVVVVVVAWFLDAQCPAFLVLIPNPIFPPKNTLTRTITHALSLACAALPSS